MTMTSVLGHLKTIDFPQQYSSWNSTLPEVLFEAPIISQISDNSHQVVTNLERECRNADTLVVWTDCDREGEYIGAEVAEVCKKSNRDLKVLRARYSALTFSELEKALRCPSILDQGQIDAVSLRCELDLRTGAILTRLVTLGLRDKFDELSGRVISYGSCQFPTLGFTVEQYFKLRNFVPEPFWVLNLEVKKKETQTTFSWSRHRVFDRAVCTCIYDFCLTAGHVVIVSVQSKPKTKWYFNAILSFTKFHRKPLPLRTVELQRFSSRYLKISSDRTMNIAEKLYNEGYISYPRTETDRFDRDFNFKNLLEAQTSDGRWGNICEKLLSEGIKSPRQGANDDKAHPPIHPLKAGGQLTGQEKMIYEFITRRFIACCSGDAKGEETLVQAVCNGEIFVVHGSVLLEANYLDVYHYDKWQGVDIPKFTVGEILTDWKVQIKQGTTTAPKLLSESELIGCMDKNGIGTDATIHEHIKKIVERTYVMKNKEGRFHPTGLGVGLVAGFDLVLRSNSLTKPRLRAELERELSDICKQIKEKSSVRQKFLRQFQQIYFDAKNRIAELAAEISKQVGNGLLLPAPLESNSYSSDRERVARPRLQRSHSPHDSQSDGDDGGESGCPNCNVPVHSKKVTKDGANKGRKFLSCDLCNFFAWDQQLNSNRISDIVKCKCGLTPVYGVTQGGANKNRGYYKCSRVVNGCGYFQFCDYKKVTIKKAKSTTKKTFKRRKE